MVLLTSSAISVAISSGVVFLFTFLLFLSGYALQQQTVKSLQEALQAPVEVRVRVQPRVETRFDTAEDVLAAVAEGNGVEVEPPINSDGEIRLKGTTVEIVPEISPQEESMPIAGEAQEPTPQQLWHAHVDGESDQPSDVSTEIKIDPVHYADDGFDMRLAYVLSLPTPADLCSAILFTKWHRQFSSYPKSQFNIIFLYPSDWETSSKPVYKEALELLIQSEHLYSVLLHPVQISKVWTGIDVESQLLGELARNPWTYDRVLYLRSPGMLLDTTLLDETIVSSYTNTNIIKTQWTKLRPPARRAGASALHPDILLFAQGRGLMTPTGDKAKRTTARAKTRHENRHLDEMKDEYLAREAAYILFDENELEHRRSEKIRHDGLFERFEREREIVCDGTTLLG